MNNFTLKGLRIRNLSKSLFFFSVVYRRLETSHRRLFRFLLAAQLPITLLAAAHGKIYRNPRNLAMSFFQKLTVFACGFVYFVKKVVVIHCGE